MNQKIAVAMGGIALLQMAGFELKDDVYIMELSIQLTNELILFNKVCLLNKQRKIDSLLLCLQTIVIHHELVVPKH